MIASVNPFRYRRTEYSQQAEYSSAITATTRAALEPRHTTRNSVFFTVRTRLRFFRLIVQRPDAGSQAPGRAFPWLRPVRPIRASWQPLFRPPKVLLVPFRRSVPVGRL